MIYSPQELAFLAANRQAMTAKELTEAFNARFGHVQSADAIKGTCTRNGFLTGRTGHFEKGHKPVNAGTKGLTTANATSFQKGQIPVNHRPVGSERIDAKDGYTLIKTAEPNQWRLKHQVNWEAKHGPVPKGMALRFIDTDKSNTDPENLELVSRLELCRLNAHGYTQAPAELKPALRLLAKLETKLYQTRAAL
jgi:hypothetical protein